MKKLFNVFILCFSFTILLTSCGDDDPCEDVNCGANGYCVEGNCECLPAYEGTDCSVSANQKFVGTYDVVYNGSLTLSVLIFTEQTTYTNETTTATVTASSTGNPDEIDIKVGTIPLEFNLDLSLIQPGLEIPIDLSSGGSNTARVDGNTYTVSPIVFDFESVGRTTINASGVLNGNTLTSTLEFDGAIDGTITMVGTKQ